MSDLISRQAAIDAIERNAYRHTYIDQVIDIIKALPSVHPETKLVAKVEMSKEDIQGAVYKAVAKIGEELERKEGKWVFKDGRPVNRTLGICEIAVCDQCGETAPGYPFWECNLELTDFCPHCGARMFRPEPPCEIE